MHERDLRRQALESSKTVSRKAKAKALSARSSQAGSTTNSPSVSPSHSPGGSRAGSRTVSRQGSDNDEEDEEDELNSSVASLDISSFDAFEKAAPEVWRHELNEVTEQIVERSRNKRNTAEAREEMLAIFTNILRAQYAAEELEVHLADLLPALLKSFKAGSSGRESVLALKAVTMIVVTTGEELFEEVKNVLRSRIQDSSSKEAQEAAIHTLGAATFFGGADIQDTEDIMDYFLDIIETDGDSVEAHNNAPVVAAALQEWGLLATLFGDLEGRTERAMECFENQLDSRDLHVQQTAGENIALIYEQSFGQADEGDEVDDEKYKPDEFEVGPFKREWWTRRYKVFHDSNAEYSLKSKLTELTRSPARYLAKDKKKDLHQTFADVVQTVEHPYRGPRYAATLDEKKIAYRGHRYKIKFPGKSSGELVVDRWWKLHRYEAFKRAIAGGFAEHYAMNSIVRSALPQTLDAPTQF